MNFKKLYLFYIVIAPISVLLAGCASDKWIKPGMNVDLRTAFNDEYECTMMVRGMIPDAPVQKFEREKIYNTTCSNLGGNVNCMTTSMDGGASAQEAGAAIGTLIRVSRQRSKFAECMHARGYVSERELAMQQSNSGNSSTTCSKEDWNKVTHEVRKILENNCR